MVGGANESCCSDKEGASDEQLLSTDEPARWVFIPDHLGALLMGFPNKTMLTHRQFDMLTRASMHRGIHLDADLRHLGVQHQEQRRAVHHLCQLRPQVHHHRPLHYHVFSTIITAIV